MPITNKWWERDYTEIPGIHALTPSAPVLVTFQAQSIGSHDVTLLRSRFFPQLTFHCTASSNVQEKAAAELTCQFVAWAEQTHVPTLPDMLSVDDRIIATAYLTPRFRTSPASPTTHFSCVWAVDGGLVESFARRKADPAITDDLFIYTALYPIDWTFAFYTSQTYQEFTYYCASEVLFGA